MNEEELKKEIVEIFKKYKSVEDIGTRLIMLGFQKGKLEQKKEDVGEFKKKIKISPERFHDIYEEEAEKVGWETHRECRVKFDDLPELNQETMINTCKKIEEELKSSLEKDDDEVENE